MKTSLLVVTDELPKEALGTAFDATFLTHLSAVPKTVKRQTFDLLLVQLQKIRREDWALLRQVVRLGLSWDLLIVVERGGVEKAMEIAGERGDYLLKPYFPLELRSKLTKLTAKRSLEKENRFWRVELAALLADRETLSRTDIPTDIWERAKEHKAKEEISFRRSRKEFEKQCLLQALERAHGNQTQAAKALGIHRNTLIWKMKKLHLEEPKKVFRDRGPHK